MTNIRRLAAPAAIFLTCAPITLLAGCGDAGASPHLQLAAPASDNCVSAEAFHKMVPRSSGQMMHGDFEYPTVQ